MLTTDLYKTFYLNIFVPMQTLIIVLFRTDLALQGPFPASILYAKVFDKEVYVLHT